MRRRLAIAALLATTCLTPKSASAAPVVGFLAGALGVATGAAIASTAAYAAGAAFAGTFFGGLLVKTAVAVGLSAIAARLQRKNINTPPPSSRMANFAQAITYAETVYGRVRKGGPLGYTTFRSRRRFWAPIIAAHPIEGIVEHWLDERVVTLSANPNLNQYNIIGPHLTNRGRIEVFTGDDPANSYLVNISPEWTEAHDFKGLSGAVLWTGRPAPEDFTKVFPTGRHWSYAPVFDGHNQIYDPRDQTRKYTNNSALVLAHWITERLGQDVDWDEIAREANVCDELVTNKEGTTQPRWTTNGTISDDQEFEDQRALMAVSCDAFMYERIDGKVGFKVGRFTTPAVTLGPSDFETIEIVEGNWGADSPTEVAGTYIEPANAWRETGSGVWVEDNTGRRVRDEPALYMVNNHNQASRINKRIAKTRRAQYRITGTIGPIGYELLGGDNGGAHRFFRFVQPELDFDEYFEIGELVWESMTRFTISANSVRPEDFDFNAATEEPDRPTINKPTNNDDIEDLTGLGVLSPGNGILHFNWDEQDESLNQQIRISVTGANDWQIYSVPSGQETLVITGLTDGQEYEYQGRNRTAALREGDWVPETPGAVTAIENATPPAALDSFGASLSGADVDVTLTAPNDENYFGTRIYRATNSTDFNTAVLVRTEYGIPSNADSWTDSAPGSGDQSYWAEPINQSNIAGPRSGPETVTVP